MIEGSHWIVAVIALASSLLLGEIAGRIIRSSMGREDRTPEIREMARPVGTFVFWAAAAIGVLVAVASTSRHAFEQIPDRVIEVFPNLMLGGLILIVGYAVSLIVAATVAQSSVRTSGVRHRNLERGLRYAVLGASAVMALSQLGVDTTLLSLALGIVVGAPTLVVGMLTAFGGRQVAAEIAAGRALRSHVKVGRHLSCSDVDGLVVAVHAVSVEVETPDGHRVQMPFHRLLEQPYSVTPARSRA
ncbi:MAG: hypothetical protein U0Q22_07165 [Acidimicrobiales bacterium]